MSGTPPNERRSARTARRPLRLLFVVGTRPEAVKLAPVVRAARARPERFLPIVAATAQHREMLDAALDEFEIEASVDLDVMQPDQAMAHVAASALTGLHEALGELAPDVVLVQGDTTTAFAGALAAFYRGIPVAHVEAGLRSGDVRQPYPEEVNRRLIAPLAAHHFAPTEAARANLLREGVDPARVWVTGNTGVDALLFMRERLRAAGGASPRPGRTLLVTAHRRESHGEPIANVCRALRELLGRFTDLRVLWPVHPSPRVRGPVFERLSGLDRVELVEPLGYADFLRAMDEAWLILTDSGGVQEEAPSLGKPVLVLRERTERPEGLEAGVARLVGTSAERIVAEVSRLLTDDALHRRMRAGRNPYGDGAASGRILDVLEQV